MAEKAYELTDDDFNEEGGVKEKLSTFRWKRFEILPHFQHQRPFIDLKEEKISWQEVRIYWGRFRKLSAVTKTSKSQFVFGRSVKWGPG